MFDVVTFGEAMLRLSPPHFMRLEQTPSFDVNVGGGELNVAIALSRLGLKTTWVSKLPLNPLGRIIRNKAREHGVDTSFLVWSEHGRAGLYFMEFGAAPRPSTVLYDRANSAMSMIKPKEVDWDAIFKGSSLFHVTGITPALSESAAEVTMDSLTAAKKAGCTTSFDLNYRAKLWTQERANKCITPMMENVDILITTEEDTFRVFGVKEKSYEEVAVKLSEMFKLDVVAITLRENITVWRNNWTAIAYAGGKFYRDKAYEVEIVDRVGSGDSFSAGFIYGYLKDNDLQKAVQYGNALSALKHSIPGDLNWVTSEEMQALISSSGLRIVR